MGLDFTPLAPKRFESSVGRQRESRAHRFIVHRLGTRFELSVHRNRPETPRWKKRPRYHVEPIQIMATAELSQTGYARIVKLKNLTMRERIGKQTTSIARQRSEVQPHNHRR